MVSRMLEGKTVNLRVVEKEDLRLKEYYVSLCLSEENGEIELSTVFSGKNGKNQRHLRKQL